MRAVLRISGHARTFFPGERDYIEVEFQANETLADILVKLGVSPDLFMFGVVRDEKVDLDYIPRDGDEIALLSAVMGG